jgi:hypothetical protein
MAVKTFIQLRLVCNIFYSAQRKSDLEVRTWEIVPFSTRIFLKIVQHPHSLPCSKKSDLDVLFKIWKMETVPHSTRNFRKCFNVHLRKKNENCCNLIGIFYWYSTV